MLFKKREQEQKENILQCIQEKLKLRKLMSKISDFKQIRKWNICFEEVRLKCINIVLSS